MGVDLVSLSNDVSEELMSYGVPEPDPLALGSPLPPEWYRTELAKMKVSLVAPYWTPIRDMDPTDKKLVILSVAVVADDGEGYLVAFDPLTDGEFVLAMRDPDPDKSRGVDAVSCGVRGDAVGCFLSR